MKRCIKIGLSGLLICICMSFNTHSQVTIGSTSLPLKGAILDLKENDEESGNANSNRGLILPRVFLTNINELSPILSISEPNYESLKPRYAGLVVYNVNANASSSLEKGVYVWDGIKWNSIKNSLQESVTANNGLNLSTDGAVKLGGNLIQTTTVNLAGYDLLFNSNEGRIGIGTSDPKATVQVENNADIDPLILKNVKLTTGANNEIDASNPNYYDLKISENGVIRKILPYTNLNDLFGYTLQANTAISTGTASGTGGSDLKWNKNSTPYDYITLPDDGFYVFSFCLFGSLSSGVTNANSYYISAFRNGTATGNLIDIEEFVAFRLGTETTTSYYINLTVSGKAGDNIYFKLSSASGKFTWTLTANSSSTVADKTTMIFWKI